MTNRVLTPLGYGEVLADHVLWDRLCWVQLDCYWGVLLFAKEACRPVVRLATRDGERVA